MNYFHYLFYCLYISFTRLNKNDFPEVNAFALMALNIYCLLLALLFFSGTFFMVILNVKVGMALFAALILFNYFYFIHKDKYLLMIDEIGKTRAENTRFDLAFALFWTLFSYLPIIIYIYYMY